MELVSRTEIEALERKLDEAVRTGHTEELEVIGYGEITIAVKLSTPGGDFVCKRLAPISSRAVADRWASLIASYIEQLSACGIDVVETDVPVLESSTGHVLYCVQPLLASEALAPNFLSGKSAEEAVPYVRRIFEQIRDSVGVQVHALLVIRVRAEDSVGGNHVTGIVRIGLVDDSPLRTIDDRRSGKAQ